jgi:hypothetical protein
LVSAGNYLTIRGTPTEEDVPYADSDYSAITSLPNYYDLDVFSRYFGSSVQSLTQVNNLRFQIDSFRV